MQMKLSKSMIKGRNLLTVIGGGNILEVLLEQVAEMDQKK
jgi:hypothetical protein